jgi:hypothetical protein
MLAHCCARRLLLQGAGYGGEPDPHQRQAMDRKIRRSPPPRQWRSMVPGSSRSAITHDQSEDSSERRSTVLARNKRDLVAATEIPATSAISFTELQCDC